MHIFIKNYLCKKHLFLILMNIEKIFLYNIFHTTSHLVCIISSSTTSHIFKPTYQTRSTFLNLKQTDFFYLCMHFKHKEKLWSAKNIMRHNYTLVTVKYSFIWGITSKYFKLLFVSRVFAWQNIWFPVSFPRIISYISGTY